MMTRLLLLLLFALPLQAKQYYLSICALFRDEARFLKEWIEYHHMLGVDHFYLYNNLSQDNYLEVLEPYINSGLVELSEWPFETQDALGFGNFVQVPIYQSVLHSKGHETFWLAFIDTDEFIVPKTHQNIPAFLQKYEQYGGVVINWQQFGTSNVERVSEDRLLIEMLTWKAPEKDYRNKYVKSIVRPSKVSYMTGPHHACYLGKAYSVAENGKKVEMDQTTKKVRVKKIQLNHYFARDEAFFKEVKYARLNRWYPKEIHSIAPKFHSVVDTSIQRFVPELKRRMDLE